MLLPIGNKLKEMSAAELNHRTMILDAILSIQAGDNPRVLAEKLESFVAPADRGGEREGRGRRVLGGAAGSGMSGHGTRPRRRRRGGHGGGGHEGGDERWLLTYADMITLLMALFMVLFSISSVNISKYQVLQHALQKAFIGGVLDGGKGVQSGNPTRITGVQTATPSGSVDSSFNIFTRTLMGSGTNRRREGQGRLPRSRTPSSRCSAASRTTPASTGSPATSRPASTSAASSSAC